MLPRAFLGGKAAGSGDGPAARPPVDARLGRGRSSAVWTLIVLATVLGLLAILATWINRQMLDNQNWTKTSSRLIEDPAIQSALSVYLVDQVYTNVDVPAALAQRLPAPFKPLAGPASAALRQPVTNAIKLLLTRPRVQALWANANRVTHQKLVNVLENKTGFGIQTGSGEVTLDLGELVKQVGPELGLPAAALAQVPPNTGVITVMRSDQLSAAQKGVRAIRVVSLWLVILVFGMYAAALYLAAGARRKTLRNIGWAFIIAGAVILVVRRQGGSYAVNALAPPPYREAGHHAWLIGSSILGQIGRATIFYGLIGVLGAVLAGPTRAATAVRRRMAPVLNEAPGLTWGITALVFFLLVLWGGTHALRTWQGILILGALLALGVAALRRETLAEFAVTTTELPAGGAASTPAKQAPAAETPPADDGARTK